MKTLSTLPVYAGLLLGIICLGILPVSGQTGSSQSNPIQIGTLNTGSQYVNNHGGFLSGTDYKVYYRFVLSSAGHIQLSSLLPYPNSTLWVDLLGSGGQVLASESHFDSPSD